MDLITAEKELALWVAEKLRLEADADVFRGRLPDGVGEGVEVKFISGRIRNPAELNEFSAMVSGTFHDPETTARHLSALCNALPVYGEHDFTSIEPGIETLLDFSDDESSFMQLLTVAFV